MHSLRAPLSSSYFSSVLSLFISDDQTQRLSRAELYLQACRQTGAVPVSSFLHNLNQANLNLNHYGVGPLGAKALAVALQVMGVQTLHLDTHFHGKCSTMKTIFISRGWG